MARLDRSSTMAWVASDGAPVLGVILVVVVEVGLLPPSSGLPQEGSARRRDGGRLLSNGG
jgi:hypothetical protein